MVKEDKAKYDKFKVIDKDADIVWGEIDDEKIEQEAEDDIRHMGDEWWKKREEKKKHLYAKLLSEITSEEREKHERELLDIL